jgi:hypothetical protein
LSLIGIDFAIIRQDVEDMRTLQSEGNMKKLVLSLFAAVMIWGMGGVSAHAVPVNLELLLLVDASSSVSSSEYDLQKTGYIDAFNNLTAFGAFQPFAVAYAEWSSADQQQILVNWTQVNNPTDGANFATAISGTSRAYSGLTAIGDALTWGQGQFLENGFEGERLIMDISGDGEDNDSVVSPSTASSNAEIAGITINGLPILNDVATLDDYYTNNVITSDGFVVTAATFDDFEEAVFSKLRREITGEVPLPGAVWLLGSGLVGLVGLRRRQKR